MKTLLPSCRLAALTTSLTLAPLFGQTEAQAALNRFIPENSTIVLRIASPAKWREQFAKTQVAKLLQGNTLGPMLEQMSAAIDMGLDQLRDSGEFDADLVESMLSDWRGDIVMSVQLDIEALLEAVQFGGPPPVTAMIAFTADGDYDLTKFVAEIERSAEQRGGAELRDLIVGDLTLRRTDNGGEAPDMTLPAMVDGAMVMLVGSALEQTAGRMLASDHRHVGSTGTGPMFMHMELASVIAAASQAAAQNGPPEAEEMARAMLDGLGLSAMQGLTMTLEADGEHVAAEMSLAMREKNRGLFAMLGNGPATPKLLRAVPANADYFSVMTLRLGALYDTVAEVWNTVGDRAPMSLDDVMQGFTEATKVRLKEDLLDHLGDEMLTVQDSAALLTFDPDALEDDDAAAAMFVGSVYAFSLKNGKAFGESLETALRSRGMHAGRKTEDYGTHKLHRLKLAGLIDLEYTVTDDLLLLGIGNGEGTKATLRSVLDKRSSGDAEMPEAVRALANSVPAGWNGIGTVPLAPILHVVSAAMVASGQLGPDAEMVQAMFSGVAEDLKRLGIGSMTSATYMDAKGLTARMRW